MRTPVVAGLLALLLPACLDNSLSGVGDGDGDDVDDMGSGSGSGSNPDTVTPRVAATLDQTTLTTENGKVETLTLTLTSEGGFTGDVAITSSLLDSAAAPIGAVTLAGPETVTLDAGETETAAYTLTIPSNTTGQVLTGELKLALSSSLGAQDLTSAVTINNFYTVSYDAGTGTDQAKHTNAGLNDANAIRIKRGTVLKFVNNDDIRHVIHGGGVFPHETDAPAFGLPGRVYEIPTTAFAPGTTATAGCHSHATASYAEYTVE